MNKITYTAVGIFLSLFTMHSASAVTVFVDNNLDGIPDPFVTVSPGASFSLNFRTNTEGTDLFGFGMITNFNSNPAFAQATGASYDAAWQVTSGPDLDNTANTIGTLANVGFVTPAVNGNNVGLYTATFDPTGLIGIFTVSNSVIGGTVDGFLDGSGNVIDNAITFIDTEIRIATVIPLPGAVWLMLSGIGALVGVSAKHKHSISAM